MPALVLIKLHSYFCSRRKNEKTTTPLMNANLFIQNLLGIQEQMKSFARTLTADEMDAEDLMQDTTLKVLANRERFVNNVNFKGWVMTIMRNIFINNYHKLVRSQTLLDTSADAYNVALPSEGGEFTPEGSMDIKEINAAISALSTTLKEPFSMFVSGYKYNEIAEALNIPLGTVKSRIFLARQELQKELKDMR